MTATDELDRLLTAAAAAGPNDRIRFRDPIAEHGTAAARGSLVALHHATIAAAAAPPAS